MTDHNHLEGARIAFAATDGFEQIELTRPWQDFEQAGAKPELISLEEGSIRGVHHMEKGDEFEVDATFADADPADYAALVLPGGVFNPDALRADETAVAFVEAFFDASKPVAAICHGPWTLVEADVVRGRTLTSWPSLKTDIRNAGGRWVDESVHEDRGLVTSRNPDDLDAFCEKAIEVVAASLDEDRG
jgi:protease I